MNFYSDNTDLAFHMRDAVEWSRFVPLWEDGFTAADGPRSLADARDVYDLSLREVGEFAAKEIDPRARAIDEQGIRFVDGAVVPPPELLANIDGLRRLGVMAPSLPRANGGLNMPFTVSAAILEIVGRACSNTMILYAFYQSPALLILRFGTAEQIDRWVGPLAEGAVSGSVAITEPEAGSDIGALQTKARRDGEGWVLDGRKQFITNGCGDVCLVLARSDAVSRGLTGLSLLLVPRTIDGRANYRVARPERKETIRGSATCELAFDGSRAQLLGPEGRGFAHLLTFMNEARVAVAIQALGLCQAALSRARAYATRRVQMGRPIAKHPLVADMLLDMECETAALRALVYRCTQAQDRIRGLERSSVESKELEGLRRTVRELTPLVKWFGAERALWVTRAAVQIHGGYGVIRDYDVERHYRDALIAPIYEGTSQIQSLMALKDRVQWSAGGLPGRGVRVRAGGDARGDAVAEMAREYNRAFRYAMWQCVSLGGWILRRGEARRGVDPDRYGYALQSAERLMAMLAYTRAAESLVALADRSPARARLADRFLSRARPLVRMHGEIVRSGDRSTLEATVT